MRHTQTISCRKSTRGFTIVEIMVALTISMILLFGVINIFLASKRSYTLQNGAARLQENARFALHIMERSISMAGLDRALPAPSTGTDYKDAFVVGAAATADNIAENTAAKYGFTTALGKASDSIEVVYTSATDCLGNAAPGSEANDLFYIATDTTTLMCLGNGNVTPQPLVDGIENMQILYGQDTTGGLSGGPDGIADQYLPAGSVTQWTDSATGGIASVRVSLLVSTVDEVNTAIDGNTYNLLDAPTLGPFSDKLSRRIFTRTILLRNYSNRQ